LEAKPNVHIEWKRKHLGVCATATKERKCTPGYHPCLEFMNYLNLCAKLSCDPHNNFTHAIRVSCTSVVHFTLSHLVPSNIFPHDSSDVDPRLLCAYIFWGEAMTHRVSQEKDHLPWAQKYIRRSIIVLLILSCHLLTIYLLLVATVYRGRSN
jgi:hypothetical protein